MDTKGKILDNLICIWNLKVATEKTNKYTETEHNVITGAGDRDNGDRSTKEGKVLIRVEKII